MMFICGYAMVSRYGITGVLLNYIVTRDNVVHITQQRYIQQRNNNATAKRHIMTNIETARIALEAGHMTRHEAARFMADLINNNHVALCQLYQARIHELTAAGYLVRHEATGAWFAIDPTKPRRVNAGGRPRKNKPVARLSITIDADLLADLDAIVARGVITRNAMIKMLIKAHVNKYKE